jgi:cobalt/nickel transport system ATP-binding protein
MAVGDGDTVHGVDDGPSGTGDAVSALEVQGLTFSYPDGTEVLRGVDLSIDAGERVALLGPNGAGKTTFVLHLIGILRSRAGSVAVDGVDLTDGTVRELRARVGFVFQDPDDQLFMPTVRQDVAFGPANFGMKGSDLEVRVKEALAMVGMEHAADKAPHHLSGGERRRVAIATVLAMRPSILILDEPSSNLDPAGRRELAEILSGLDVTLLMVTHDLPYAFEVCERSVVMSGGVIAADGPTATVLSDTAAMTRHRLELPAGFHPHHL